MDFVLSELCDQVMTARAGHKPLFVMGGGSKSFYGNYRPVTPQDGHCLLDMTPYRGIVNYHPSELVVTVRAGTPLADLEAELAAHGQMLAFEPPHFGPAATVGGCVAAGLSGPRRMSAGALRDFVLGARLLDSDGRMLSFGGEVMKNVAGYDVSRLLAGSHGIFGALLEVSLKVVPKPMQEVTLARRHAGAGAVLFRAVARQAAAGVRDQLERRRRWRRGHVVRAPVRRAARAGQRAAADRRRRDGTGRGAGLVAFAARADPHLLRTRQAAVAAGPRRPPPRSISVRRCWSGAAASAGFWQLRGGARERAASGGHATLFRPAGMSVPEDGVFHPLAPALALITRRLKQELDPAGLFNPGRLILEL